ncbi:hypothetical protein Vafri_17137 [Volvox africanus]|uniref:Uncharacterized protein n=1 Tax=Volvox africanus TaxID=51714 RepID=A0A8J4F9S7_9CHLO|nr:hypothetical protein Vafri_17137 [Volvox africanus]
MCIFATRIRARKLLCAALLVAIALAQGSSGRDITTANVNRQLLSRGNDRGDKRPTGAGRNDDHPEHNSTLPGRPELNGTHHNFNETHHNFNETRPEFNGTRPELNGTYHDFNETRPEFNGTRPDCNGTVLINATRPLARPPTSGRGGYGKGKGRDLLSKDEDHGRSSSFGPKAEEDDDDDEDEEDDDSEDDDKWAEHNSTFPGRPDFNGTNHDFNETHHNFNGTRPELNGTYHDFNETHHNFNGTRPELNGTYHDFNETRPEFNGTRPEFKGIVPVNVTRPLARPPTSGRGGHGKDGKGHGRRLLRHTGRLF